MASEDAGAFVEVPVHETASWRNPPIYIRGGGRPCIQASEGVQSASGTCCTSGQSQESLGRYLAWSVKTGGGEDGNVLSISEFSLREELSCAEGLRVYFPVPLACAPCLAERFASDDTCTVMVLTVDAMAYWIDLPHPASAKGSSSVLEAVSGQNIRSGDLSSYFEDLEEPVSLVAGRELLCIGTTSGVVLCVPLPGQEGADLKVFELRDAGEGLLNRVGRWAGMLHKPRSSLRDLRVVDVPGATLLFAIHEDCALRVWSLGRETGTLVLRTLLSFSFGPAATGPEEPQVPVLIHIEEAGEDADSAHALARRRLVVYHHAQGALEQEGRLSVFTVIMRRGGGGSTVDVAVDFEAVVGAGASSRGEGRVVDARLAQGRLWVLTDLGSRAEVAVAQLDGAPRSPGGTVPQVPCLLLDDSLEPPVARTASSVDTDFARAYLSGAAPASVSPGRSMGELSLSRMFCSGLLGAGGFSRRALRQMLRGEGRALSAEEAKDLTLEGLRTEVVAAAGGGYGSAAAAVAAGGTGLEGLGRWSKLLSGYQSAWREVHRPLGLMTDPVTGGVGVVRAGLLTVLRPCDPAEAARAAAAAAAASPSGPEAALFPSSLPAAPAEADLVRLAWVCEAVAAQLGPLAGSALGEWVAQGADVAQDVVPFAVSLLEVGAPPPGDSAVDDVEWEHRSERRRRLRLFGVKMAEALRLVRDLPAAVATYTRLLASWESAGDAEDDRMQAGGAGGVGGVAVARAVAQGAAARLAAARGLAVVVGWVGRMRGQVGIKRDAARHVADLLPEVVDTLRWAHIIHWLSSTYAGVPARLGPDARSAMSSLHLSDAPGNSSPSQGGDPGGMQPSGRASDSTLAELLYPLFRAEAGGAREGGGAGPGAVSVEAGRFARYLRWGPAFDGGPRGGGDRGEELEGRVLDLGSQLFAHQQFDALDALLLQVAGRRAGPAVSFLRGLCACARMQRVGDSPAAPRASSACAHFFRAAAGLRGGPDAEAHAPRLRELLATLQRMVGAGLRGPSAYGELQYLEALMLVFERLGCSDGAYRFAHAAVRLVDVAYDVEVDGGGGAGAAGGEGARREREGRLWANIFQYAMDARRYTDAYAALISNPIPVRSLEGLRALIPALCEAGAVDVLCELPLVGAVEAAGEDGGPSRHRLLLDEAVAVLERRARYSEVRARPNPYQVLYAFHTCRSNHAQAAGALYAYAERLRVGADAESVPALQLRASALAAAANSLELADPRGAFLEVPAWAEAPKAGGGAGAGGGGSRTDRAESPAKRARYLEEEGGEGGGWDAEEGRGGGAGGRLVTLKVLRRQSLAAAASLEAARLEGPNRATPSAPSTPAHTALQLLSAGRYHSAFSLLVSTHEGARLTEKLADAFRAMAERCVQLQRQEDEGVAVREQASGSDGPVGDDLPGRSFGLESELAAGGGGGRAARAWRELQAFLALYDTEERNFQLRVVVADAILAADRRVRLPTWLVRLFHGGALAQAGGGAAPRARAGMGACGADPAALIRVLMKYGMDEEAAEFASGLVAGWAPRMSALELEKQAAVWLPYGLLTALLQRLPTGGVAAADLQRAVGLHVSRVGSSLTA